MAKFFVGQRVRIVRTTHNHAATGAEARIVGRGFRRDWQLEVDGHPTRGAVWVANSDQLEPIQPEGMQPAKWEDCMWQPDKEHANAR